MFLSWWSSSHPNKASLTALFEKRTNNKKKSDRGLKQKKHSVLQWNDQHKFSWLAPVFWMKFLFIFTVCPSRIVKWRKRRERERWRKKIIICWMGKNAHLTSHIMSFFSLQSQLTISHNFFRPVLSSSYSNLCCFLVLFVRLRLNGCIM